MIFFLLTTSFSLITVITRCFILEEYIRINSILNTIMIDNYLLINRSFLSVLILRWKRLLLTLFKILGCSFKDIHDCIVEVLFFPKEFLLEFLLLKLNWSDDSFVNFSGDLFEMIILYFAEVFILVDNCKIKSRSVFLF